MQPRSRVAANPELANSEKGKRRVGDGRKEKGREKKKNKGGKEQKNKKRREGKMEGTPRILLLEAFSSEGSQPKSALKCKFASSRSAATRLRGCIPEALGAAHRKM